MYFQFVDWRPNEYTDRLLRLRNYDHWYESWSLLYIVSSVNLHPHIIKMEQNLMLKIYERGEHKGGFIGVRVAVMIDGKHKQKYFSYKQSDKSEEAIYKEAEQLHKEWLMLKSLANSKNQRESKEMRRITSPYSTGVKGIKFNISHSRAYFFVQGSTDNKLFHKNFSINDFGYDLAWYKAYEYLQTKKGYSLFDNIYKRRPPKEMLLISLGIYFLQPTNKSTLKASLRLLKNLSLSIG